MSATFDVFFGPLTAIFLIGITSVLFYWYSVRNLNYWKKRGVPTAKTVPLFGSLLEFYRKPLHDIELERHQQLGRIYGYFEANNPVLSVAEPQLLRKILVKDFQFFMNRRDIDFGDEVFNEQLSVLRGEDWKRVRNIMTPSFTTGKLKRILGIFKECTKSLIQNFRNASGKPVDLRRLYGAFTMDAIASTAFSTKIDSHNNPDNPFVKAASEIFNQILSWKMLIFFLFPRLSKLLGFSLFNKKTSMFFKEVIGEIIEEREKTGKVGNDFLQLLLDTTKEGPQEQKLNDPDPQSGDIASNYGDAGQIIYRNVTSKHLSMNELVAQSVSFFFGGFDPTSTTLALATYFLAIHPEIQDKLRAEVDEVLKETDGEMTYDSLCKMTYLDNVISETLRLYPPAFRLERSASTDYELEDMGITIPKGMIISIPLYALHRDPEYFPEPDKFKPERFSAEEREKRDPYAYLPFGAGPRNCVGLRFILMEVKVCLAAVVTHFIIKRCPQTLVPMEFQKNPGLLTPKQVLVEMDLRND